MARIMLTIPDELLQTIDAAAQAEHRSRSEFLREAARAHLDSVPQDAESNTPSIETEPGAMREASVAYSTEDSSMLQQLSQQLAALFQQAAKTSIGEADLSAAPQDLHGVWADAFADDFDVDAALQSVRSGWQQELADFIE